MDVSIIICIGTSSLNIDLRQILLQEIASRCFQKLQNVLVHTLLLSSLLNLNGVQWLFISIWNSGRAGVSINLVYCSLVDMALAMALSFILNTAFQLLDHHLIELLRSCHAVYSLTRICSAERVHCRSRRTKSR